MEGSALIKRFAIICAVACILIGCGTSYRWSKSHPLYTQVPYSALSVTGTENAFILTRSKWFAKKLEVAPESAQVQLTAFARQVFLDEMKRAYPALKELPDTAVTKFPEESQKLDDKVFIKGHFPEQGVNVKDAQGGIPQYILILHEFIIGTDINREVFYDYELIRQESAEKKTSNNLSAILSYTLWDNENQRPLFSAVDEIQRPIAKLAMEDLRAVVAEAAKKIRINLYEGVQK